MELLEIVSLNKDDLIIYKKNNLVVLYNKKLSKHFILSNEVYNFFELASNEKITINEFLTYFEREEDKKYIKDVIDILIKIGAVKSNIKFKEDHIGENIYICLTNKCNLRCRHCCSNCSIEEKDFLNTNEIKNMIDIIKNLNPKVLVFTGGEPLIRSDFKEIILYAKQIIPKAMFVLSTNGTLINDTNIDFIINNFYQVDISVDGVDEETCAMTRGKGVFDKVVHAVKNLQARGFININLSMVFGDKNESLQEKFLLLNKSLKTNAIERSFIPEGRGKENSSQYLSNDAGLQSSILDMFNDKSKKSKNISSCNCSALKSQLFINYDGNIYPCPSLIKEEYMIGNIFNPLTISILKNNDLESTESFKNIKSIYPYNFEKCKDCDVNVFCWTCPAMLDALKENDYGFDIWCKSMKSNLNRIIWEEEVL